MIFMFFITNKASAQEKSQNIRENKIQKDSIGLKSGSDTVKTSKSDSAKKNNLEATLGIKISKDALSSVVKADAQDSAVLDMQVNQSFLYGKTQVTYEDIQINSGQVIFNQGTNVVTAAPPLPEAAKDTSIAKRGTFKQGSEKFTFDSVQYNFKSKRAIVRNVQTQYGEGYMHSEQIKRNPDQVIYGSHSIYTTCALDTPHFGIYASKIKVVPNKLIVSGPANINIMGVPTPIFLPFALFPISQKQKSGFVIPTYTIEESRGLGLLNGGYYFYLNDNVDLLAQTNFYTKGSYAVSGVSNYSNIYHYHGGVNISYAFNKTGESFEPGASVKKDFIVNWRHSSDAKSVPGQTFNASVQLGTSSFYSNNSYDPNQILQNQYQSNITYSKNWQGKPFGLTISALHSQNTGTKQINVTLPQVNFHVTQFNPFVSKRSIGSHWYDKVTSSYNVDMMNKTTFYDSTFNINNLSARDFQSGIHHSVPVSASYTVLRYINMSFGINYNEYWLTRKIIQGYNDGDHRIDSTIKDGFFAERDFNTSVNLSTRIYGMKVFKHGSLRGIRHVITPNVGISYHPDFAASPFNYYYQARLDSTDRLTQLSPYFNPTGGSPAAGKVGAINFGLNNNLQIKVKSGKDTATGTRNVILIDGLSFNSSYNAAVDSFQWSAIGVAFRTNILDKINITSSASFDPYAIDYNTGKRIKTTIFEQGGGLGRFTRANLSAGANFHSKSKKGPGSPTNSEEYTRIMRNAAYNEYVDFNIPWSVNLSYTMDAANNYSYYGKKDTIVITHNATVAGELQVTQRWKVSVNSGYNFTQKQLTLTSIDVFRDLHCWAMHLQTYPFGPRKSFNFTLNVKAAVLQDLKIMRRRDYRDTPL